MFDGIIYSRIRYHTDKLARCVGGTETTQNHVRMQSRKCRSCKLWRKEAEKKNRNTNTFTERKTFCSNVVLQQVFEITTKSRLAGLTVALVAS
ncbi:hypothetical protein TNCV_4358931 [Trichonephila clavipes]|nr:hypothetical protein TNCV_36201 [Trichonephila clavipes]GFW39898.1 hypothetical protein TNCV_4358931 [Trichonephila clavipes]